MNARLRECLRAGVAADHLHAACCPGKSGGSSSSNATETKTENIDKRQVVDAGSIGVSSDESSVTVNASYLDDGAVNRAIDLATVSTESAGANIAEVLGFAKDALKVSGESLSGAAAGASDGLSGVLDFARDVLQVAGENLDGTKDAFAVATEKVSAAYQTVGEMSNGQRFMVAGGLVLAGIVAVKAIGKK